MQEALLEAWLNFDPQRYAEEVLADAPLDNGCARITTLRLIPHLPRLRRLTAVDIFLPAGEEQTDLAFVEDVPALRYFSAPTTGMVDVSPLKAMAPRLLYLYGAVQFTNLDQLPQVKHTLGLFQVEPWHTLDFLCGRELINLALSEPAPDCDMSPIADMGMLRRLGCHGWVDLSVVPALAGLEEIEVDDWGPIDIEPLRNRSLVLELRRRNTHIGI